MRTIHERIASTGLTMDYVEADRTDDHGMPSGSRDYRVTIKNPENRKQLTVSYSMGPGCAGRPELAEVMNCICMDAAGYVNARSFEEWANEYGYDADSRRAEWTYRACGVQLDDLRRLLGDDEADAWMFDTEGL